MTDQPRPELLERFKPTAGRLLGIAGVAIVLLVAYAVASTGLDRGTIGFLAALALILVLVWAALIRPALRAYDDHLLIRNSWSDVRIPWGRITDVDVKQTLQVYVGHERHHCVAVGKSARQIIRGGQKRGVVGGAALGTQKLDDLADQPTLTGAHTTGMHYADYVVIKIQTYASAQRGQTGQITEVTRTWAWPEIAVAIATAATFVAGLTVG